MKTIAIISEKGGVGKTTLSINLGVAAALKNKVVAIIDLDPQSSSSEWGDLRSADTPAIIATPASRLNNVDVFLQAFINNGDHYFVTEIKVYKDGRIDCWGMVDFDGFKEKVSLGWLRTHLPEGARVSMMVPGLYFTAHQVKSRVEEQEFVKEVEDEIRRLNGQLTTGEICRQALTQYKHEPSKANKEYLRQAYDAVPKHCRMYLGDMDDRDSEYRSILNRWSD